MSKLDKIIKYKYHFDVMKFAIKSTLDVEDRSYWHVYEEGFKEGLKLSGNKRKVFTAYRPYSDEAQISVDYLFIEDDEDILIKKLKELPNMPNNEEIKALKEKLQTFIPYLYDIVVDKPFKSLALVYNKELLENNELYKQACDDYSQNWLGKSIDGLVVKSYSINVR